MPKLIDYPRTSYTGAWEVAEIVDDTGGKCALETSARKLNRKVSGSFKAIVGSAVKFGLLTSKREILTTTTLFRRIKHAYDKQEELLFHREAFLTPPLFTQLCRKFRSRELPVAMLDVLLMREFDVEEINAQSVAKAFIEGARMVGLLNENNIVADIDQLAAQQPPRREIASPAPAPNVFRQGPMPTIPAEESDTDEEAPDAVATTGQAETLPPPSAKTPVQTQIPTITTPRAATLPAPRPAPTATSDAIASLFGMGVSEGFRAPIRDEAKDFSPPVEQLRSPRQPTTPLLPIPTQTTTNTAASQSTPIFTIQLTGPGINTQLEVTDIDDLALVRAVLDKIERRLKA